MDIQSLKLDLIQWLADLKDVHTLKQLRAIKEGSDWWDEISEEERQAIDSGLAQLDRGEGIPHEKVMQKGKDKYDL